MIKKLHLVILFLIIPTIILAGDSFKAKVFQQDTEPPLLLYFQYNNDRNQDDLEILSHYYLLPDSSEAVVEEAVLKDGSLLKYNAEFYVTNESSSILLQDRQISITYTKNNKTKSKTFAFDDTLLVGPLFVEFLVSKWDKIMDGNTVKFKLPAADMLTTAGFYLKKINNSKYEKPGTVVIKMGVSSIFLKLLIKSSFFVMDTETRQVKEIHGLSILPHQENGAWEKTTNVDIYYEYE